jgi:hypothetical protein
MSIKKAFRAAIGLGLVTAPLALVGCDDTSKPAAPAAGAPATTPAPGGPKDAPKPAPTPEKKP